MRFEDLLERGARFITEHEEVTLVGHADGDGVCATAILEHTLNQLGKQHTVKWIDQISTLTLQHLEVQGPVLFIDMGSSHLHAIEKLFSDVLIIDHHQVENPTGLLLVNPVLAGLDGTSEACSATIAFEIASLLIGTERLAPIALIGVQADHQEPFRGYNKRILDESIERGQVTTREGARLFGVQTKPLIPLIAYSYDLQIAGVTGSQEGARKLLEELEIDKRYYGQLSPEEQDLLNETLIRRSKNPDARVTFYTFEGMPRGPLRDTREAASLINACGRMGQPDTAVQALLTRDARRAIEVQRTYRTRVKKAHEWYEQLKPGVEDGLLLLNGKESILPSVAGVLCSSLVRGGSVPEGTVVVCLARYGNGTTKVSARTDNPERNLARLLVETAAAVGGEGGGHDCAAGAIIPTEAERSFLERVRAAF